MKIENQVCTPVQAEKLNKLAIAIPSLHQWWKMKYPASEESFAKNRANCLITPTGDNHDRFIMHYIDNENAQFHWSEGTYHEGWDHSRCELEEGPLAAYNVAELGEMLPATVYFDHWKCSLQCVRSGPNQEYFMCQYVSINYSGGAGIKHQIAHKTEAECRAAMLIHLIESGLTSVQEINQRIKQ